MMLWYIVHCVHFWNHFKSHSACPALQCQKCNYAEWTHTQTSQHFFYPRTCFLVLIVNVQLRCGGEERGGGKFECRKRERKKLCNNGVKVIEFFDWCATTQNIVITFVMHSYTHTHRVEPRWFEVCAHWVGVFDLICVRKRCEPHWMILNYSSNAALAGWVGSREVYLSIWLTTVCDKWRKWLEI